MIEEIADWRLSEYLLRAQATPTEPASTVGPLLWSEYLRPAIPPMFGYEFSTGSWNQGYVSEARHLFLLVTLDKSGHSAEHAYQDRFLSPSVFEWQSPNGMARANDRAQRLRSPGAHGSSVHLFVRPAKKTTRGGGAPFTYCGEVTFIGWQGDNPITVQGQTAQSVPPSLCDKLRVPTDRPR